MNKKLWSEAVVEEYNKIREEERASSLQDAPGQGMFDTRPNCRCPACGVDMLIAGWYDKSQSTLNGVSQCQHECIKCGKRVTPVKIS